MADRIPVEGITMDAELSSRGERALYWPSGLVMFRKDDRALHARGVDVPPDPWVDPTGCGLTEVADVAPLPVRMDDLARDVQLNNCVAARPNGPHTEPDPELFCGTCWFCLCADYLRGGAERLRAVADAVRELRASHYPDPTLPGFCIVCSAADGHWPCTARLVSDDLEATYGILEDAT